MLSESFPTLWTRQSSTEIKEYHRPRTKDSCQPSDGMAMNNVLNTVSAKVRQTVLDFLQAFDAQNIHVSPEDVHHYLGLCERMPGLEKLRIKCKEVLLSHLDIHTAIYMLCLSSEYHLEELRKESMSVISQHLEYFLKEPSFTTLNAEQMIGIIDLRMKMFGDIDTCYCAIVTWSELDPDSRKNDFQKMLTYIGKNNGSTKIDHDQSRQKEYQYQLLFSTRWKKNKCKLTVRVDDITRNKTYQTDCKNRNGSSIDISLNYAVCCHQLKNDKSHPPYVIVTGGADVLHGRRTLVCDLINNKWKIKGKMTFSRQNHSLCSVKNRVYAIGGYANTNNDIQLVRQVEEFNLTTNTWQVVASLPLPVYSCACISIENLIYIIGGKDEQGNDVTAVQVFDIEQRDVISATHLPFASSGGQAEFVDESIYYASSNGQLVRIDPSTLYTKLLVSQPRSSRNFAMYARDSHLVFTYFAANRWLTNAYNVCTNSWMPHSDRMPRDVGARGKNIVTYPSYCNHVPFCD